MPPRWTPESNDAAVLAQAILSGVVTHDLQTFKDFFDPESTGPGAAIGEKYGYSTKTGNRNLKGNWQKLLHKINVWKSNKVDEKTGKPARFSESFLKKAKFPTRPELLSDVPREQQSEDFVPGIDQQLENIIKGERQEDDDSLTIHSAGGNDLSDEEEELIEEEEEDDEEEEPPIEEEDKQESIMPKQGKLSTFKEPLRDNKQCAVSWEVLNPTIAYIDVEDPDVRKRQGFLSRRGIVLRVDIPSGVVPSSFVPMLSADCRTVEFTCYLERSRYHPKYTIEPNLQQVDAVCVGMQKAMQDQWTFISKRNEAGEVRDYRKYTVTLPERCEREFRNPYDNWNQTNIGVQGTRFFVEKIRSMFYYCFFFTEASKEFTPAMATVDNLLRVDQSFSDNPMNATNMARTNYYNDKQNNHYGCNSPSPRKTRSSSRHRSSNRRSSRRHHRSKSRHRSRRRRSRRRHRSPSSSGTEEDLANTLKDMSLCADDSSIETHKEPNRSSKTRSREEKSRDHNNVETASRYRERVKGKQRRFLNIVCDEIDSLATEDVKKREKEVDNALKDVEALEMQRVQKKLLQPPKEVTASTTVHYPPPPPLVSTILNPSDTPYDPRQRSPIVEDYSSARSSASSSRGSRSGRSSLRRSINEDVKSQY